MRTWVKDRIPERYRLLRYEWQEGLRYYPEVEVRLGRRLTCPFCGRTFRWMRPAGLCYEILRDKQAVGASRHPDDVRPALHV